jgi:hypothetical protein
MKRIVFCSLVATFAVLCWLNIAVAAPVTPNSVLVAAAAPNEMALDDNVLVSVTNFDFLNSGWQAGLWVNDAFVEFVWDENNYISLEAGGLYDFAISSDTATIHLSNSQSEATWINLVDPDGLSTNPTFVNEWYNELAINWIDPETHASVLDITFYSNPAGSFNGFAAVPIPASALLLATCAIGLIGIRRKFMK